MQAAGQSCHHGTTTLMVPPPPWGVPVPSCHLFHGGTIPIVPWRHLLHGTTHPHGAIVPPFWHHTPYGAMVPSFHPQHQHANQPVHPLCHHEFFSHNNWPACLLQQSRPCNTTLGPKLSCAGYTTTRRLPPSGTRVSVAWYGEFGWHQVFFLPIFYSNLMLWCGALPVVNFENEWFGSANALRICMRRRTFDVRFLEFSKSTAFTSLAVPDSVKSSEIKKWQNRSTAGNACFANTSNMYVVIYNGLAPLEWPPCVDR